MHAISSAGDTCVAIALAGTLFFSVPDVTDARLKIGLYLLLTMTPFAVLGPIVGPALDRRRGGKRAVIVAAGALRATSALVMALATDSLLLYPAAFAVLAASRAHAVARTALVPVFLPPTMTLVAANAQLARTAVLAGAIAGAPAVLLMRIFDSDAALGIAAVLFVGTGLLGTALPPVSGSRSTSDDVPDRSSVSSRRMRTAFVVNSVIRALGGFLLFLLAFGLRRQDVGSVGFAFVLAAAGVGSFAGATLVPRMRRAGNEEWILVIAPLIGGGSALIASRSFGLDLAAVVAAAVGLVTSAGRLAFDAILQRDLDEHGRGRAFARYETMLQLWWVGGAAVPVALPIAIPVGLGMISAGFLATAAWFLVALGPSGRRRLSG